MICHSGEITLEERESIEQELSKAESRSSYEPSVCKGQVSAYIPLQEIATVEEVKSLRVETLQNPDCQNQP
jgi:hypothetical protein